MRRAALDAYIAKKIEIDTMLDRLKALSDDHFNVAPGEPVCGPAPPAVVRRGPP